MDREYEKYPPESIGNALRILTLIVFIALAVYTGWQWLESDAAWKKTTTENLQSTDKFANQTWNLLGLTVTKTDENAKELILVNKKLVEVDVKATQAMRTANASAKEANAAKKRANAAQKRANAAQKKANAATTNASEANKAAANASSEARSASGRANGAFAEATSSNGRVSQLGETLGTVQAQTNTLVQAHSAEQSCFLFFCGKAHADTNAIPSAQ